TIAKFEFGKRFKDSKDIEDCYVEEPNTSMITFYLEDAVYHKSWDWLMPVLEKVMTECFELEEESDKDLIEWFYCIRDFIPDINRTYSAIIEFIEWYNKNYKQ